jgi:uncharacterized protein YjbI with pentapeptide repeats
MLRFREGQSISDGGGGLERPATGNETQQQSEAEAAEHRNVSISRTATGDTLSMQNARMQNARMQNARMQNAECKNARMQKCEGEGDLLIT